MPIIPRSPVYSSERATGIEISRENALCFTSLNKIPMLASQSINSGKYRILKSAKLRLNAKQQNIAMSTEEIPAPLHTKSEMPKTAIQQQESATS